MRHHLMTMLLLSSTASALHAQTAPTDADGEAANTIPEIVVTAQRRSERVQDVPIAISAFSGDQLRARQITQTLDLIKAVPNLQGHNNTGFASSNTYFMRGLGNTESIATFDPPVGTYVDDIYVSRQNANNFAFFDVDRIEVLRGPQGTLFGRNTTGGAINVILKAPADELGGYLDLGYGRFDRAEARGSIDLPLSEAIGTKFSAYYFDDNGYVTSRTTREKLNDQQGYGVRGAVRANLTDTLTWDVATDYTVAKGLNAINFEGPEGRYALTGFSRNTSTTPFTFAPGAPPYVKGRKAFFGNNNTAETFAATSHLTLDLGKAALESITGWRDLSQRYGADFADGDLANFFGIPGYVPQTYATGGFTVLNDGRHRQFSQEIKVNGTLAKDAVTYVAGVFYMRERNRTDFADINTSSIPLGPGLPPGFPLLTADRVMTNNMTSKAAYAQIDIEVAAPVTLTAGIRYTDETKTIGFVDQRDPSPFIDPKRTLTTANLAASAIPTRLSAKVWTPRFAVEYRPTGGIMMYASATRGFKSGGWSARATEAQAVLAFTPEKVWTYEAGFKADLLDQHLRINGTVFHMDVTDFQVPSSVATSTGVTFVTRNFADMRNTGAELELTAVPVTGLNLFANVGLQNAKLRNPRPDIVAQQAACRAGIVTQCGQGIVTLTSTLAEPTRAPNFTFAGGARYEIALGGSGLSLTPSVNANYVQRNPIDTANTTYQPSHWVVDASLTLAGAQGRWSVSAECSNCFDRTYAVAIIPPAPVYLNEPARWMVRTRYRF